MSHAHASTAATPAESAAPDGHADANADGPTADADARVLDVATVDDRATPACDHDHDPSHEHDHEHGSGRVPFGGRVYGPGSSARAPRTGLRRFALYRAIIALLLAPIWLYQVIGRRVLPPMCRYEPSCSDFMVQSIRQKGVIAGLLLGIFRVLRCNPFVPGGWDPPEAWGPKRKIKLPWPRPPWPGEEWVIRLDLDDDTVYAPEDPAPANADYDAPRDPREPAE